MRAARESHRARPPQVAAALNIDSLDPPRSDSPPPLERDDSSSDAITAYYGRTRRFVRRTWHAIDGRRIVAGGVIGGACAGAFTTSWIAHTRGEHKELYALLGNTLPLAKGTAQAMKVVFTLLLLPICRHADRPPHLCGSSMDGSRSYGRIYTSLSLSHPICRHAMAYLRECKAANAVLPKRIWPFDDNIAIHRYLGATALLLALVHTCAHAVNFSRWSVSQSVSQSVGPSSPVLSRPVQFSPVQSNSV